MKTELDPKTDVQMTTISRIVNDRAGRNHPAYTGGAPKRHDFVTYDDRKCLMLGSNFQVVLRDAWMNGMPADTQDEWFDELLARVDLFPFAGPDKYVLDLEGAYKFVKTHHPRSSIKRFWETLDWSKAPRLGGCLIDTIQRILTTLTNQDGRPAELGEKLGWGEILWLGNRRVMALDSDPDESLTGAWGGWIEAPVRLLGHGKTRDHNAEDLIMSLQDVFPSDGFGNHGVSSHYEYVVIDLDAAYDAVMEAHPWANIQRVWDAWAWRKAPIQPLAPSEAEQEQRREMHLRETVAQLREMHLRETVAQLRETVARLRQTYEEPSPEAHIEVVVSGSLSQTCLERLQDALSQVARTLVMLDKGHDSRPRVTCKIKVQEPKPPTWAQ